MFNWKKFDNIINKYACQELIMNMELFDELFFKKYDKSKYTLLERRKRKQLTKYGKIKIKRRKYRNKETGNIFVPVDDFFGIIKNSNINADLWNTIFDEVDSGSTIPQIKKIIPDAKISHSSISGILSAKKPIITSNEIIKKIKLLSGNFIRINTDDTFKNLKDNGYKKTFRIRLITFNTGKDWDNYKKRFKLINKRYSFILTLVGVTIYKKDLVNFVKMKINDFYELNKETKIIVYGDGAIWIKSLAKAINAIFVADRFHPFKILSKALVMGKNKKFNEFKKAIEYFKNNNHMGLMKLLNDNKVDKSVLKYFEIIKIGMIYQNDSIINIGSSAESDVYHVVKSTCSGARIFCKQHFLNMLNKKIEKLNSK